MSTRTGGSERRHGLSAEGIAPAAPFPAAGLLARRLGARVACGGALTLTLLASTALTPACAADVVVATFAELNAAIAGAANGDTITLAQNITLKGDLAALTKSVTIAGNGWSIDGGGQ